MEGDKFLEERRTSLVKLKIQFDNLDNYIAEFNKLDKRHSVNVGIKKPSLSPIKGIKFSVKKLPSKKSINGGKRGHSSSAMITRRAE